MTDAPAGAPMRMDRRTLLAPRLPATGALVPAPRRASARPGWAPDLRHARAPLHAGCGTAPPSVGQTAGMQRSGWNPARRSRNIGTSAQGQGADNEMVVPDRDSILRRLEDPQFVEVEVAGGMRSVVVERTRPDTVHACTVEDVVHMLELVNPAHLAGLDLVVLRQPTRKQANLEPVWGSLRYYLQVGRHTGGAFILDAVPATSTIRFERKMTPDQHAELERLRASGAKFTETRRSIDLTYEPAVAREVQLYRTVLHEIGHWVDYLDKVEVPAARPGAEWDELWDRYWQRPTREREAFAHRYADETGAALRSTGAIPFERRDEPARIIDLGLRPTDFALPEPA